MQNILNKFFKIKNITVCGLNNRLDRAEEVISKFKNIPEQLSQSTTEKAKEIEYKDEQIAQCEVSQMCTCNTTYKKKILKDEQENEAGVLTLFPK